MKTSSKFVLSAVALASAAFAQTSYADPGVSYNVGVVSEYRYRGIAQTKGQPALQGGVDYDSGKGFYLGVWGSTIKWIEEAGKNAGSTETQAPVEVDLYGGYKFEANGYTFDVGYLRYEYAGNKNVAAAGMVNPNTDEIYAAVTRGPVTLKYSQAFSTLFGTPNSQGSEYWDLSANFDIGNGFSVIPHFGHQKVKNSPNISYSDYSLGLGKDYGNGLLATIAAVGTNVPPNQAAANFTYNTFNTAKKAVVVGLKYTF